MIKYFSFNEVNREVICGIEEVNKNHKFLYESLNRDIKYYEDSSSKKKYINYFDKVYFEISEFESKPKKFDFLACYMHKDISDEDISINLRGSKTLKIKDSNCYDNTDIKTVFSENGFAFIEKFGDQSIKFERIYISFLLAHAYNLYSEKLMLEVSKSYTNNNIRKMLELRKEIYIFDLNCFFSNPVNYKYQQQHTIWSYLSRIYSVEQNHKEMKSQIKDLVNLIEMDLKDKEQKEKELEKNEEERKYIELQQEREEANLQFNKKATKLTIITVIIAFLSLFSLISAYKDYKELTSEKVEVKHD